MFQVEFSDPASGFPREQACTPRGGWKFRLYIIVRPAYLAITHTPGTMPEKARLLGFFLYLNEYALHALLHGSRLFLGLYQIVCQSKG